MTNEVKDYLERLSQLAEAIETKAFGLAADIAQELAIDLGEEVQ